MKSDNGQQTPEVSKRRALGRGLESLLPSRTIAHATPASSTQPSTGEASVNPASSLAPVAPAPETGKPREIPLDQIDRNPFQTRSRFDEEKIGELAASIAATGVVQPILVRALPDGRFQLIAGERRLLASKVAGKETIPAILRQVSDEQAMEMTIVENLQRTDLNAMEQARAYERLSRDFKMTQEQMARRTGKDRASVSNFLRLLRLPHEVQGRVESGELSFGHARSLLAIDSPEMILKVAQRIIALSLSVRQTESFVQILLDPDRKRGEQKEKGQVADPNVREAQERLQRALGLKVRIEDKNGRGRVVIEYGGLEDFDSLLAAIAGD